MAVVNADLGINLRRSKIQLMVEITTFVEILVENILHRGV